MNLKFQTMTNSYTFLMLMIFISFLLLTSCNRSVYSPGIPISSDANIPKSEANILMIQEKGDIKVSGDFSAELDGSFQAGYSPKKHLSVSGQYFLVGDNRFGISNLRSRQGFLAGLSVGGYYFLETGSVPRKKKIIKLNLDRREGILFDIHAGYEEGRLRSNYEIGGRSNFKFQNYFIQPGIHLQQRVWSLSYIFKMTHFNLYEAIAFIPLDFQIIADLDYLQDQNPLNIAEHTFMIKGGNQLFDIYLKASAVSVLKSTFAQRLYGRSSLGMTLNINEVINLKNRKK